MWGMWGFQGHPRETGSIEGYVGVIGVNRVIGGTQGFQDWQNQMEKNMENEIETRLRKWMYGRFHEQGDPNMDPKIL